MENYKAILINSLVKVHSIKRITEERYLIHMWVWGWVEVYKVRESFLEEEILGQFSGTQ